MGFCYVCSGTDLCTEFSLVKTCIENLSSVALETALFLLIFADHSIVSLTFHLNDISEKLSLVTFIGLHS